MELNIKYDIIKILGNVRSHRYFIASKGDDERDMLSKWLKQETAVTGTVDYPDEGLQQILEACKRCGAVIEKRSGIGNGKNGVMVILNSPVLISKIEKDLYRNDSIQLLKNIIKALELEFNECYITSLIKCETGESLMQPSEMVANCSHIIKKEIEHYQPAIIIVMGDLIPMQKIIKESTNISWHNIEHPITLLKNPELKRKAWETLKIVIEKLKEL